MMFKCYTVKSSFRYQIKYWIGANWVNWHDWMHEHCTVHTLECYSTIWNWNECGLFRPFYLCLVGFLCVHFTRWLEWLNVKRLMAYLYSSITERKMSTNMFMKQTKCMIYTTHIYTQIHAQQFIHMEYVCVDGVATLITELNIIECH